MTIAYLGPAGTFTEAALRQVDPDGTDHLPASSVPAALAALRDGRVSSAVVPIENSVEGGVSATLDAVAVGPEVRILAEMLVPIRFNLVATQDKPLSEIKAVSTHSHAWAQVRDWAETHVPQAEYIPASSTAAGALGLLGDEPVSYDAAICAPTVCETHPELVVLAENIGDNPEAVTRFVHLGGPDSPLPERTGADRTTLVIPLWEDRAGALMEILEQFATRGVNLSRIESRPTGNYLGDYFFSVDVDGHVRDERVAEALVGLRRICPTTRFLGSYARADHKPAVVAGHHTDGAFTQARDWVADLRGLQ
ncbi:prephenate dehydratase [Kocuria sp. JC486]|uniref:prephenate dehydratase n=1 Tax=Kocuria sp. JC486 TaxID=1970736 RepID=UPI001420CFB2|nr:prephenate dehydratase [Kocuria sp. JC486]NHU85645.1 prephenate dehydratase [Kocuria sp. JC486]